MPEHTVERPVASITGSDAWNEAGVEHQREVTAFVEAIERFDVTRWHGTSAPGRWSAAALALHVTLSYEFGIAAARGGPGMRMRSHPAIAFVSRTLVLPLLLAARRFPRGARAPAEVQPDEREALRLSTDEAIARLRRSAQDAIVALREAADHHPTRRIAHAYFGPLTPLAALRMLSAHTRHHLAGLAARRALAPSNQ